MNKKNYNLQFNMGNEESTEDQIPVKTGSIRNMHTMGSQLNFEILKIKKNTHFRE